MAAHPDGSSCTTINLQSMTAILFLLLLLLVQVQVQGFAIRTHVHAEISLRCKALQDSMPYLPKQYQRAFSAIHICKPDFKVWFWQTPDDKPLIELEHNVQAALLTRQRRLAIMCFTMAILLLAVGIRRKTTIAHMWWNWRRNPVLSILKLVSPVYASVLKLYFFAKSLGVMWWIAFALQAFLATFLVSRHYTLETKLKFCQMYVLVFVVWVYTMFQLACYCIRRQYGHVLRLANYPFENILMEDDPEVREIFRNVAPAFISFFM